MPVRDTSIKCFNELKEEGLLNERQIQVYNCLKAIDLGTDKQISQCLNLPINCITGRRKELEEMTLVYSSGIIKDSKTNRSVNTWKINETPDYKTAKKIATERGARVQCPCCQGKGYVVNGQVKLLW